MLIDGFPAPEEVPLLTVIFSQTPRAKRTAPRDALRRTVIYRGERAWGVSLRRKPRQGRVERRIDILFWTWNARGASISATRRYILGWKISKTRGKTEIPGGIDVQV